MMRFVNDSFLNEIVARDSLDKLRAVYGAIKKWEQVASQEFAARHTEKWPDDLTDLEEEWLANRINDEAYILHHTNQALLGSFAVTIFSTVENVIGEFCNDRQLFQPNERPNWKEKRKAIEAKLPWELNTRSGFPLVDHARLLANCFKHREGKVNPEFAQTSGRPLDQDIEYEREPWDEMVRAAESLLLDVAKNLR